MKMQQPAEDSRFCTVDGPTTRAMALAGVLPTPERPENPCLAKQECHVLALSAAPEAQG